MEVSSKLHAPAATDVCACACARARMQYILYVREVSDIVFVALSGDDSVLQGKKKLYETQLPKHRPVVYQIFFVQLDGVEHSHVVLLGNNCFCRRVIFFFCERL